MRARALFARGLACVEEHETACAEQAFREALALRDSPAIRYNLASALFDLGRYPEAARLAASVLADETTPAEIRGHAEALQGQLDTQAGTLEIGLAGLTEGTEVRVDSEPIPESQQNAVMVAPGSHEVTVLRGDAVVAREQVEVERGARVQVALTIVPSPEALAAGAEPLTPSTTEPGLHEDWRLWAAVGGAVVVVVVVVVVIAIVAGSGGVEAPVQGNFVPGVLRWE